MTVSLAFLGAADTVTGSRTLVSFKNKRWLIDCGLFQGDQTLRERNWARFTPEPKSLDKIILTHAHLDHSGYLPKLCSEGYKGPILATEGTTDLCGILLRDAAHLELESAGYANKTGYSRHKPALPLFTENDAVQALSQFSPQPRNQWLDLSEGVKLRFLRAGHIIGSSLVQLCFDLGEKPKILTFTGDLGNGRSYLLRPPEQLNETDVLVLEATYGDRLQARTSALAEFAAVIKRTAARKGVLLIPAFAVGRAQELTYMIRLLEDRQAIPTLPVILDSPMATSAMEICLKHKDDQVLESAFHHSTEPFLPKFFEATTSPDESMLACMRSGPLIIISASGMLSGGRILHHLKWRLPEAANTLLFTGYQAEGSKGRFVQDQAKTAGSVRIHHEEVAVEAEIVSLSNLSAHADQQDILDYTERMRKLPSQILINHGAPESQKTLALKLKERFGINAQAVHGMEEIKIF